MDFAKLYRKCCRTGVLSKGVEDVKECVGDEVKVEPHTIHLFGSLGGYRLTANGKSAFFPGGLDSANPSSGLSPIRSAFLSVDLVLPPYYTMQALYDFAIDISRAKDTDGKLDVARRRLLAMYSEESMADMFSGVYLKRESVSPFAGQILESMKAYFVGLYSVAIAGLVPCIEGVLRNVGVKCGRPNMNRVDLESLLKAFKVLNNKERDRYFDGFDWVPPILNINFLDGFHERIQMMQNIVTYFEDVFYQHTEKYTRITLLNRHGITHALFDGYASQENYLRLITLLNALTVAATLAEGKGSLFHPSSSPESEVLAKELKSFTIFGLAVRAHNGHD